MNRASTTFAFVFALVVVRPFAIAIPEPASRWNRDYRFFDPTRKMSDPLKCKIKPSVCHLFLLT